MGILGSSTVQETYQDALPADRTFPYTNQKHKWYVKGSDSCLSGHSTAPGEHPLKPCEFTFSIENLCGRD